MRIALKGKGSDPTLFAHKEFEEMKAVREKTGLSQSVFATMIGVKVKTLQNWEQHRRNPTGAAALLPIFDREPETAMKALHSAV